MIQVFNGKRRGLGDNDDAKWLRLDFGFRDRLHHFKGARLSIFMALCLHCDENGFCFPSYDTLQAETGYNRQAVSQALKDLCAMEIDDQRVLMKWRERNDQGRQVGSNRYRVFPTKDEIDQYENQTDDQYENQTDDQYENQTDDQYENQTDDQYENQTDDQYENQTPTQFDFPTLENQTLRRTSDPKKNQDLRKTSKEEPSSSTDDDGAVASPKTELMPTEVSALSTLLQNCGVGLTAFTFDQYSDLALTFGMEATIRGITSAAENHKAHVLNYVRRCVENVAQGTSPKFNGNGKANNGFYDNQKFVTDPNVFQKGQNDNAPV